MNGLKLTALGDLTSRAAWTFIQAFVATVASEYAGVVDVGLLKVAAIAGVAAALSVVKTALVQRFQAKASS